MVVEVLLAVLVRDKLKILSEIEKGVFNILKRLTTVKCYTKETLKKYKSIYYKATVAFGTLDTNNCDVALLNKINPLWDISHIPLHSGDFNIILEHNAELNNCHLYLILPGDISRHIYTKDYNSQIYFYQHEPRIYLSNISYKSKQSFVAEFNKNNVSQGINKNYNGIPSFTEVDEALFEVVDGEMIYFPPVIRIEFYIAVGSMLEKDVDYITKLREDIMKKNKSKIPFSQYRNNIISCTILLSIRAQQELLDNIGNFMKILKSLHNTKVIYSPLNWKINNKYIYMNLRDYENFTGNCKQALSIILPYTINNNFSEIISVKNYITILKTNNNSNMLPLPQINQQISLKPQSIGIYYKDTHAVLWEDSL